MRLKKIELHNFKQYYGTQIVEFAGYSSDDVTNVTIVYGENGKGKTTLYRAVVFALHGDKVLEQDLLKKNDTENRLVLGNLAALRESESSSIDVYVKLSWELDGKEYEIKRSVLSTIDHGEIEEVDMDLQLIEKDQFGKINIINDPEIIVNITEQSMDPKMRNYFLFDGEQIEQMTKSSDEQRNQVRRGIKKLLGIDALYDSIEVSEKLKNFFRAKLKSNVEGDYKLALMELESLEGKISEVECNIDSLIIENRQLEIAKKEIDQFLLENQSLREKAKERMKYEAEKESYESDLKKVNAKIKTFNKNAPLLAGEEGLKEALINIKHEKENLGSSFNVNSELLKTFLTELRCGICGTEAVKDSIQYRNIQQALENLTDSDYREALSELLNKCNLIAYIIEEKKKELKLLIEDSGIILQKIKAINSKINELKDEIEDNSNIEAAEKEKVRESINKKMGHNELAIKNYRETLPKLHFEKNISFKKIDELRSKQSEVNINDELSILAEKANQALSNIRNTFTQEIADQVSETATRIYYELLDKDSRMNLKKVIVKDDFSLDILSWSNNNFLANISSGQRHILSISFILALLEISEGTGGMLKTPLFMDTPFGRISGDNRDNLLANIPQKASQWILLVTDTEFTKAEVRALRPTEKWGKVYSIELIGPGKAIINEGDVATFEAKR